MRYDVAMARRFNNTLGFILALLVVVNPVVASEYASRCATACGGVTVQYPFGFTDGCGLPEYRLNCTSSALLISTPSGQYQVLNVTSSSLIINATDALRAEAEVGNVVSFIIDSASPYEILDSNVLFGYGCNTEAFFVSDGDPTSCQNSCQNQYTTPYCDYYACCQQNVAPRRHAINISASSSNGYASIIYPETYSTPGAEHFGAGQWGMALGWFLEGNCSTGSAACSANSTCQNVDISGYVCACDAGFHGDGYINGTGCVDVDECRDPTLNACAAKATCTNTPGNYNCTCSQGFEGDGFKNGTGCILVDSSRRSNHAAIVAGATSASVVFLLAGVGLTFWCCMRKRRKMQRFTRRNIEALGKIKHFVSSPSQGNHTATLYTVNELEKATRNFANDLVLGVGGFGTVYKGTLDNGLEVAVKRTNQMDVIGAQQLLNEVSVLSQVNHRNLVRLHGCCLEVEVPMLVYEFVPNGDLSQHLRGERPGLHLNWEKRLQIAIDTAEALRYLHSAANPPIYHRDMKTSNILLDDKFNAKVADFGISKLVRQDVTHVSTAVQGTPGYLDPEYFHSYHLTDKSDVYSFGVVLLELITSLKPLDFSRDTDVINLVAMAIPFIREGDLEAIVDPKLMDEDEPQLDRIIQEIQAVAELAALCLANRRVDRPAMKDVVAELIAIKGGELHEYGMSDMDPEHEDIEVAPIFDGFTISSASSSNSNLQGQLISKHISLKNGLHGLLTSG